MDSNTMNSFGEALDDANDAEGIPLIGERPAEDGASGPVSWNAIVNAMADAQGVAVGSWDWNLGGPAAFSGSSGAQSSYGWRHDHKLSPSYIRSVLANYGHRRSYYTNAPWRQFGYEAAGRPHGWTPELPGDQADGAAIYWRAGNPVRVTGPDAEHLWLTPLFALIDDPNPIMVDTGQGNQLPSNMVARFLATLQVSSAVGMVRDKNGDGQIPYPWTYGDRATGRLAHTIVEGFKRGLLPRADVPTAARFLVDIVLGYYENGRGVHQFGRYIAGVHPPSAAGRFPVGLFNALHWIVPVCHDIARVLQQYGAKAWADRFDALVRRWSQWMVDLHAVNPDFARAGIVFLAPEFDELPEPPASIAAFVRAEDFHFGSDFRPWAFRAVDIAHLVTGELQGVRDQIADEFVNQANQAQWLVGADGSYA